MSILALFVLLGVLITVHELGHFIVARLAGVRVLTFSLGFGPKILRFQRGETEYCISVLPLGGYVRMYGDDVNEDVPVEQRRYAFLEQPFLVKSAIALAGPVANLLLPLVLFFAIAVGEQRAVEARVGSVLAGEPAAQAGLRPGDRIVAIDGEAVGDFDALVEKIGARAGKVTRLSVERQAGSAAETLELTLTPTAAPSPDPTTDQPIGRIGLLATKALPLVVVDKDSAAATAGVQRGDRVLSVDGAPVVDGPALAATLAAADPAQPLRLVVERTDAKTSTKTQATVVVPPAALLPSVGLPAVALPAVALPAVAPSGDGATPRADGAASPARDAAQKNDVAVDERTDEPAPTTTATAAAVVDVKALRFAVLRDELAEPTVAGRLEATRAAVVRAVQTQRAARGLAPLEGLITAVEEDSPAGARGLKANEQRIVAVDGQPLRIASDLPVALQSDVEGIHVVGLVDDHGDGAVFAFRMQKSTRREMGGARFLGVGLASAQGEASFLTRQVGVVDAARSAWSDATTSARVVLAGYWMLLSGKVGLDQIGGPVLIANLAGEAARAGAQTFVATMCLVSVNLAFLNLLPVPVLDGGHLMLFSIEAIRRKRLTVEARIKATKIGMMFVGALMLIALFNDVRSLLP
jgi:membrane-associated protease RseP (regulator of RpoE activity)